MPGLCGLAALLLWGHFVATYAAATLKPLRYGYNFSTGLVSKNEFLFACQSGSLLLLREVGQFFATAC